MSLEERIQEILTGYFAVMATDNAKKASELAKKQLLSLIEEEKRSVLRKYISYLEEDTKNAIKSMKKELRGGGDE